MTLADKVTVSWIALAPAYLLLPIHNMLCFSVTMTICIVAELTDFLDGRIARALGRTTAFGKVADPFCDVVFRGSVFFMLMLPIDGVGMAAPPDYDLPLRQLQFAGLEGAQACGLTPWLAV